MISGKKLTTTSPSFEIFRLFCYDNVFGNIAEESNLSNTNVQQGYEEALKKQQSATNFIQFSETSYYPWQKKGH